MLYSFSVQYQPKNQTCVCRKDVFYIIHFFNMNPLKHSDEAVRFRRTCRDGSYQGPTAGKAPGFAQVQQIDSLTNSSIQDWLFILFVC